MNILLVLLTLAYPVEYMDRGDAYLAPPRHEQGSWQNTPLSYVRQAEELQLLANQGDLDAQTGLAELYERGLGVPQNFNQAIDWYRKAAGLGYEPALVKLRSLGVPAIPIPPSEPDEKILNNDGSGASANIIIRIGNTYSTRSTFGLGSPRTFIVARPGEKRFEVFHRSFKRNRGGFTHGLRFPTGMSRSGRLGKRSVSYRAPLAGG